MSPLTATIIFSVIIIILFFILFWVLIALNNCKYLIKNNKIETQPNNINNSSSQLPIHYQQKILTNEGNNMRVIKLENTPEYQTPDGSNILFVIKDKNNSIGSQFDDLENINNNSQLKIVEKLKSKLKEARDEIKRNKEKLDSSCSEESLINKKDTKINDVINRITKLENMENKVINKKEASIVTPFSEGRRIIVKNVNQSNLPNKIKYISPQNTITLVKQ